MAVTMFVRDGLSVRVKTLAMSARASKRRTFVRMVDPASLIAALIKGAVSSRAASIKRRYHSNSGVSVKIAALEGGFPGVVRAA